MKRKSNILTCILMGAVFLLGSQPVMAAEVGKTKAIQATYNGYKTFIDGVAYTVKNALGEPVEPFAYNGSIYVPMEMLTAAMGEDFTYNPELKYLIITTDKQPAGTTAYLSDLQYSDFITQNPDNAITIMDGSFSYADAQGNTYDNGIILFTHYYAYNYTNGVWDDDSIEGDSDDALSIVDYTLGGQYKNLSGTILLPAETKNGTETNEYAVHVLFYGDGELLYSAKQVNTSRPHNFSIDVSDVNTLSIKVVGSQKRGRPVFPTNHTVLTNAVLSK